MLPTGSPHRIRRGFVRRLTSWLAALGACTGAVLLGAPAQAQPCPAIETVVQYEAGAGGALMWTTMSTLPGDGVTVVGVNLPHTMLQPMEGNVQYKTEDITPVYWFHYTPDALVVPEQCPIKTTYVPY
ncbi:MAG: hypothetical protein ACOVPA_20830, partial [Rubrivivax sp.]